MRFRASRTAGRAAAANQCIKVFSLRLSLSLRLRLVDSTSI